MTFSVIPGGAGVRGARLVASGAASGGLVMGMHPAYDGQWSTRAGNVLLGGIGGAVAAPIVRSAFDIVGGVGKGIVKLFDAKRGNVRSVAAYRGGKTAVNTVKFSELSAWQKFKNTKTRSTGARELSANDYIGAEEMASKMYNQIRASKTDIADIARNTGLPEFRVRRIKDHLFNDTHQLDHGIDRFGADPLIVEAWKRLETGSHGAKDISLLKHEIFESKYEGIFKTDYRSAHLAAKDANYPSPLEGLSQDKLTELYDGFLRRFKKG